MLFRYESASHVADQNQLGYRCQNQLPSERFLSEPHYGSLESNCRLRLIVRDHGEANQKGLPVVLNHVNSA